MRGKDNIRSPPSTCLGITPAYAGKSFSVLVFGPHVRDRPRVCGEKSQGTQHGEGGGGSPPRMRGKAQDWLASDKANRITPAHAGKSVMLKILRDTAGDHPRACGEKFLDFYIFHRMEGSPPRMRGKEDLIYRKDVMLRITPAHAGKSTKGGKFYPIYEDHPRACGEKNNRPLSRYPFKGSPPRMRGKVFPRCIWPTPRRITPAHAGKSPVQRGAAALSGDHPRACGEKLSPRKSR